MSGDILIQDHIAVVLLEVVHVTPESADVYIYPLFTPAYSVTLSEDIAREAQSRAPEPVRSVQVTPESVLVYM